MGFPTHANQNIDVLFDMYDRELSGPFQGKSVINYVTSHDDPEPFDPDRQKRFESATKLLLAPGGAQIYYGDELG